VRSGFTMPNGLPSMSYSPTREGHRQPTFKRSSQTTQGTWLPITDVIDARKKNTSAPGMKNNGGIFLGEKDWNGNQCFNAQIKEVASDGSVVFSLSMVWFNPHPFGRVCPPCTHRPSQLRRVGIPRPQSYGRGKTPLKNRRSPRLPLFFR